MKQRKFFNLLFTFFHWFGRCGHT